MNFGHNLKRVKKQISQAEQESHRQPGSVLLLAVSKQQSAEKVHEAYTLGQIHFAESYLQEAQQKMVILKALPLCWHFIGPIQSNKAKGIAHAFDWVHSINRMEIAHMLNQHRSDCLQPLQVCLQINTLPVETKNGVFIDKSWELATKVSQLPNLCLRGLMTIAPQHLNYQDQYTAFTKVTELMHDMNIKLGLHMDTLSMGMSNDFVCAIQAGSTMVRVGQALFGARV
ncbi:MAG: YggS family pyridoxal phosphate-dependent enzyme [Legionella sp.]|nr:YggS family pyridoxal phosphate-dependent enzyme [Legionella sp.]